MIDRPEAAIDPQRGAECGERTFDLGVDPIGTRLEEAAGHIGDETLEWSFYECL